MRGESEGRASDDSGNNKLFALKKKFSEMSDSARKAVRQVKAEPFLEAYWLWLKTLDPVPGSKLAEAVPYAQNQKLYLSAFLAHGEVDISNNFAENAIRPFTVGRKSWQFSDTTKGAESSALVYMQSASLSGGATFSQNFAPPNSDRAMALLRSAVQLMDHWDANSKS